jgi:hypothetical protein
LDLRAHLWGEEGVDQAEQKALNRIAHALEEQNSMFLL